MTKLLGDITTKVGSGATPRGGKKAYKSEGISLIRSMNVYDFSFERNGLAFIDENQAKKLDNVEVIQGDILFNITGDSICRTCLVPEDILPARVNQHVSIIRCKRGIDSRYINYYLINLKPYLMQICGVGGTRNALTKDALLNLPIRIPKTQQKIANVLSTLDAKIELNNKINAELEAMAKLVYDYWFVQFDFPTSAAYAASVGKPLLAGQPYKSSGGKMVYNEELKRDIPEGWEVDSLGNHLTFTRGISYTSKSTSDNSGIPMINLKSFNLDGTYRENGIKYYTGKVSDERKVLPGDLIIAITDVTRNADIISKGIIVPKLSEDQMTISCDLARVNLGEKFQSNYLRYLFNSDYFHNYIKHFASGTLVLHLDLNGISWFKTAIPPKEIQTDFENMMLGINNKIELARIENQELTSLRDWLLPMLMNGQVTVGDAEEKVAARRGGASSSLSMAAEGEE